MDILSIIEENAGWVCHPHNFQGRKDHQYVGQAEEPPGHQATGQDMDQLRGQPTSWTLPKVPQEVGGDCSVNERQKRESVLAQV